MNRVLLLLFCFHGNYNFIHSRSGLYSIGILSFTLKYGKLNEIQCFKHNYIFLLILSVPPRVKQPKTDWRHEVAVNEAGVGFMPLVVECFGS